MRLRSIFAENMLSFARLDLRLQDGLNVLVGPNDIGKTNVIRLVDLVRRAAVTPPNELFTLDPEEIEQFVRHGSPEGRLAVGIELTEPHEIETMNTFVRAVAARLIEAPEPSRLLAPTYEERFARRQAIAEYAEEQLSLEVLSPLATGRLVFLMRRQEPVRWTFGYEFDVGERTFHIGLRGEGVIQNWVLRGPLVLGRHVENLGGPPSLIQPTQLDKPDRPPLKLDALLPVEKPASPWDLSNIPSAEELPLTMLLARHVGLAAAQSHPPSLGWVLRDVLGRALSVTTNPRRPPRTTYTLEAVSGGLPTEDAGDLPLALFRMKVGKPDARVRYKRVQSCFTTLTGRAFDVQAQVERLESGDREFVVSIEPQVEGSSGWVRIDRAGAGLWETIVAIDCALQEQGRVALMDEPAVNLHATLQTQLLRELRQHPQVIAITHAPHLAPADDVDDLARVVRLASTNAGTDARRIDLDRTPDGWLQRWRQILAGSTDARSTLFSAGVVLVEGDTELGAFRRWFNDPIVVESAASSLDGLSLALLAVDGDWNFGPYVSYLEQMGIPWAIVADGPALSPRYKHSLKAALSATAAPGQPIVELVGPQPAEGARLTAWRRYWRSNGVFTVATQFGLKANGDKRQADHPESGEIERWFSELDPDLWASLKSEHTSKVRQGYAFAEEIDLRQRAKACAQIRALWQDIYSRLK